MARRPHHPRFTAPALARVVCTVTIAAAVATSAGGPAPAYADVAGQIRQTQARLDALNTAAEIAAEHFNAGEIALRRARMTAVAAAARVAQDDAALAGLRRRAASFAADAYRGGAATLGLQLLASAADPTSMLTGLSALDHVARSSAHVLTDLAAARRAAAASAAAARTALRDQQRVMARLEADKAGVARNAEQASVLLAQLQVKQAALIRAAADAAARRAAQRRADELAAQAARNARALVAFASRAVDAPEPAAAPAPADPAASAAPADPAAPAVRHQSADAAAVAVRVARAQLGKPYVWGAAGPDAFDCSGLTMYAYEAAGISLPHYTGAQWDAGRHVAESDLQPGDLIFFGSDLHHMAMYLGGGQLIHAPHSGDVVQIASLSGWFSDNYAGAVRISG